MIEFVNITKKFKNHFWEKEFLALSNISFKIQQGDLVGFLGANGAGKTTLIKCLMDFSKQTSGEIIFDKLLGTDKNSIKNNIGYLPERAYLYQYLTGREFLEYVGRLNSIPEEKLSRLISEWTEKLQINFAIDRVIKGYSKGMQQRLGFVSALIHNPKILILDEPLSGLDPIGRRDFKRILKELNAQGTTIFFSSHIVSDVEELCSKVVFLEKGHLIYHGSIEELIFQNTNDLYVLTFLKNGVLESKEIKEEEKNSVISNVIASGANIISLEKMSIGLEEIIYKIKK